MSAFGRFNSSPPVLLLLLVEVLIRVDILLSIERREARRMDSCVILCRRPASECRNLREQRAELRLDLRSAAAIAIFVAVRPGDASGLLASSADKRSSAEMLTTNSAERIFGGDWEVMLALSDLVSALTFWILSTSSSSFTSSCFLFCTSSCLLLSLNDKLSSTSSGFVCLFLRVARFGFGGLLALEVETSEIASSSGIKLKGLTDDPRRLLRFPFENLRHMQHKHKKLQHKT